MTPDIVAEPIVAHRIWHVIQHKDLDFVSLSRLEIVAMREQQRRGEDPFLALLAPKLSGVAQSLTWAAPVATSFCANPVFTVAGQLLPERHEAPDVGCHCGFWGLKHPDAAHATLARYGASNEEWMITHGRLFAYGTIAMWGRIYEHPRGFRSQYAQPLQVNLVDGTQEEAEALAAAYQCEVHLVEMPQEATRIAKLQHQREKKKDRQAIQSLRGGAGMTIAPWWGGNAAGGQLFSSGGLGTISPVAIAAGGFISPQAYQAVVGGGILSWEPEAKRADRREIVSLAILAACGAANAALFVLTSNWFNLAATGIITFIFGILLAAFFASR